MAAIALIVALIGWGIALPALIVETPIGRSSNFLELLGFIIPVFALIFASANSPSRQEGSLLWAIALAPFLGLLSILAITFAMVRAQNAYPMLNFMSDGAFTALVSAIVYAPLILRAFKHRRVAKQASPSPSSDPNPFRN